MIFEQAIKKKMNTFGFIQEKLIDFQCKNKLKSVGTKFNSILEKILQVA